MASLDYAYRRLVNTLGPERVARSEFERMVYSHDFASLPKIVLLQWKLYPDFVALPQTTEEVAALDKLSDESLPQITPRGGGTEPPYHPVPPPRGVIWSRLSSLSLTRAATSSVVCGKATKSGYSFHWRRAIFGRDAKSWLYTIRSNSERATRSGPRVFTSLRYA